MLKVVHTIHAFTATSGGTAACTYDLVTALNKTKIQAEIIVTQPEQPLMGNGEPWIIPVENDEKTPFGISANLHQALLQTDADIYHTNGLWRYCNHVAATIARQKGKPFVLTPHGMLYPQALASSKWQKQLLRWMLFDRDIREAACIHVTCEEEMLHLRTLGYVNPIAIIGNPVPESLIKNESPKTDIITFGFLGRLHPRKRVERIIEAMASLSRAEQEKCELLIIGSGEAEYETFLRRCVEELRLTNVRFTGFLDGVEKEQLLTSLHALFVPSDFENFGMIIAEALRAGTPVFASTGTPWKILNERGCGWWQEATPTNMATVMHELLTIRPDKLEEMGTIGRQLIRDSFSAETIAQQMTELYNWIITKQNKPSFVYE